VKISSLKSFQRTRLSADSISAPLGSGKMEESAESGLEAQVFKSLSHQIRRDIVRFVGERAKASFSEVRNSLGIEDSSVLSYHLNGLRPLLQQRDADYVLSELGKHAYKLILGTEARLKMKIRYAIVANALLWAGAIFSISNWQGRLQFMTMISLAALWFISNLILYQLSR
jgi:hypothetical protein